jgi:hypothetical protein
MSYDASNIKDNLLGMQNLNFCCSLLIFRHAFWFICDWSFILLDPEGELCSYLEGLAKSSDVQAYIKVHSFGRPMIDSSHPDWSFYSNVSKIVS